jgi:hypothetical protein
MGMIVYQLQALENVESDGKTIMNSEQRKIAAAY